MAVGYTNILIFILRKITLMMLVLKPQKKIDSYYCYTWKQTR